MRKLLQVGREVEEFVNKICALEEGKKTHADSRTEVFLLCVKERKKESIFLSVLKAVSSPATA